MRFVFVVFCLLLDNVLTQASTSSFNCEELSSNIKTLKDSSITKKEKFTCILNLLKSALTDELENTQYDEEKLTEAKKLIAKEEVTDVIVTLEKVDQETVIEEKEDSDKLAKVTQDKKNNTKNNTQIMDVPTMIPIFKPRPTIERHENFFPSRTRSIPVTENRNPVPSTPRFTIPCQRAADILDMSIAPRTEPEKVQSNIKPIPSVTSPVSADQKPTTLVHCTDLDESVGILFRPKAISLIQVYGNLLKKITITVLVPYHMSKMGQK